MIYIESHITDPYFNLAMEEYVFDYMDKSKAYFILWQNEHTIVVGKYQNTAEEINQEFVDQNNIRVVRRLSGGGAVYHDSGNLNYTFIVDKKSNADFNFRYFAEPVIKTLAHFGIKSEFTGRNDVVINGKKFSGNSQYVKAGRILHHGCIMLDSNLNILSSALKPKAAKFESKSIKSIPSRVTTINANSKTPISMEQFKNELKNQVFQAGGLKDYVFSEDDRMRIEEIKHNKYETWDWNYGKSATYNFQRELKFDFGIVSAKGAVQDGVIKEMRFSGDFFGNGDIKELETLLAGEKLDADLAERLKDKMHLNYYISGMQIQDLQRLLR
ncbi:MAG: lipoate--protein ligase [Clostridiales Family XIII bacterium]|nr:lipoate--protein ligase [Clostridia bacterium]MDY3013565.1 lipoate--protein ligase [Clostridiales Family XIII bacterium]